MSQNEKDNNCEIAFVGNDWRSAPAADQIEIVVFGPGYGEAIALHIGSGRWVLIDSCISGISKRPASLDYLTQRSIDPAQSVDLILATHWHDDHIRGLSAVVSQCPSATFCCASSMTTNEFFAMAKAFDGQRMLRSGSAAKEIMSIFENLRNVNRPAKYAIAARQLFHCPANQLAHGHAVNIVALSPSDKEYELAISALIALMPEAGQTQYRAPANSPNHLAVVLSVTVGPLDLLLGADLEQVDSPYRGWTAVLRLF